MRRKRVLVLAVVLFLAPITRATVIWSDGFESGDFSNWTQATGEWTVVTSSQSAASGLRGASVQGSTGVDPDWLSVQVPITRDEAVAISYDLRIRDGLEGTDVANVGWSGNGQDWNLLTTYADLAAGNWQHQEFVLPATAANIPNFTLGFWVSFNSSSDRLGLDNVQITTVPEPLALSLFGLGLSWLRRR